MSPALAGGFFTSSTTWEALPQRLEETKWNMNVRVLCTFCCSLACIPPSGVQSKIRVLGNQDFLALPLSPEVTLGLSVKWR